jgi:hypothetical protein
MNGQDRLLYNCVFTPAVHSYSPTKKCRRVTRQFFLLFVVDKFGRESL